MSRYLGTWEDWREEIEEIRDLGTQVYVASTQRGRGKGSGIAVENVSATSLRYGPTRSPA